MGRQYSGLGFKIVQMMEYLSTVPAPRDVVMFTDAYDVTFTGACSGSGGGVEDAGDGVTDASQGSAANPGAPMLRRFAALGARVLLGAELELNPDYSLASLLPLYTAHNPSNRSVTK